MKKWDERCLQEEILWKQKSRVQWLKEGEKNAKFFHRPAIDYKQTNKIICLKDEQGNSYESHKDLSTLLVDHFAHIATEPDIDREEAIREVVVSISTILSEDHNRNLDLPVSMLEVEEAI